MKKSTSLLAILTASFLAFGTSAQANNSVLLNVNLGGKHTPHSGSSNSEVHHRWLDITVTPLRLSQPTSVDVEWTFFADDLASGEVVIFGQKTQNLQVLPGQPVTMKSADTVFSYVREHGERVSGSRKVRYKKVEASGKQFHGWAVRAFIEGKVISESYSHPSLARHIHGAPHN